MSRPRPTDAEFAELKRKRDESLNAAIDKLCAEQGWARDQTHVHVSGAGECYCDCPDGPCQHIWNGPNVEFDDGQGVSRTCSRCGEMAFSHSMRFAP